MKKMGRFSGARALWRAADDVIERLANGLSDGPHDLRRNIAAYASRSRVPIEIVSQVILRHANLLTLQIYLGKVPETEAMRWMENLYA